MSQNATGTIRQRWGVTHFGYWANAMVLWVGSRVLWVGYVFVWLGAAWFFVCVPKARRASMGYLDRLRSEGRGGAGRKRVRRWWETYRHMVVYGYLLLDRALMLTRVGHGFEVACEGRPHLVEAMEKGAGVMMFTGHFGNAEAVAPNMQKLGLTGRINLVMYQEEADATERFHKRYRHLLEKIQVINTTHPLAAGIRIIAALRRGEVVALRADRRLEGKTVAVQLLGGTVALPAGPFVAAALSGAAVVHVYTCRVGYRRYVCRISPVYQYGADQEGDGGGRDERIARAAGDFARHLEEMIRAYPLQWGNFYDVWEVVRD